MRRRQNTGLWIVQGLLAAAFLLAGGSKLVMSAAQMASPGPAQLPVGFIRFIGVCEVLGAVGMILPGATGIRPGLTPLGAAGLVIIMLGATVVNILNGMAAFAMPTLVLGLMAAYVAYGRWAMLRGWPEPTPPQPSMRSGG
ncbi:MAG TPA: DoxX family protein [Vicinamibacterales bacterium]|nr:DoxX family protein [Vicinamibacterales bacterium]